MERAATCIHIPSELRVSGYPSDDIQVQWDETVTECIAPPVFGDPLVTLTILKASVTIIIDREEALEYIFRQNAERVLRGMVGEDAAKEEVRRVSDDHASERTVVELRVGLNAVFPAAVCGLGENVLTDDAMGVGAIINVAEKRHVHRPGVSSDVNVIAGHRRVGLDQVM